MKIANETLKKLTATEVNDLQLMGIGVLTCRGNLKSRKAGYKVTMNTDTEIHFEFNGGSRIEFIKLASTSVRFGEERQDWAMRLWDKTFDDYSNHIMPVWCSEFFK